MSHIKCPRCASNEHITNYGLAVGGMGSYTVCFCGAILEYKRDLEGYTDEMLESLIHELDRRRLQEQFCGRLMLWEDIYSTLSENQ